jgi:hypothetical protein
MDGDRVKGPDGKFGTVDGVSLSRDAGGAAGYDQIRVESGKTIKLVAALKPGILLMDLHMHDECEYPPPLSTHRVIYVVKVKIGAVMVAHFVGNQPPGIHAWVLSDDAPGPIYGDGPIWRMELAVPAVCPDCTPAVRSQN